MQAFVCIVNTKLNKMYCFGSILVLTSVKQFGIMHIEKDKRDGDIGQISQWFPFCLYVLQCVKTTSTEEIEVVFICLSWEEGVNLC